MGIDIDKDGKKVVSMQIIKLSSSKESGGGGAAEKNFVVISNRADTIFAALRGMLNKIDKKIKMYIDKYTK